MGTGRLVITAILSVFLFLGLIRIFVDSTGVFFYIELVVLFVLLLVGVTGLALANQQNGQVLLFALFLLYILNLVYVGVTQGSMYITLLILATLGFFLAMPNHREEVVHAQEPHSVVFDEPEEKKVAATHSPGKYLASKSSNVYHEPKCEWAKKIKKERQNWFAKKEDAWEQGYKAHKCVE